VEKNRVLAIIPARGGSKGLPGKNIRLLGDKPLIAWTIQAALGTDCITRTVVTTDCKEIAKVAKKFGADVPFLRPEALGTDSATTADVVYHVINSINENFDIIILLQPTSPYRNEYDIQNAFDIYSSKYVSSVVSVCETDKSPYWCFWRNEDTSITPILSMVEQFSRRQGLPKAYSLNGAIYIVDNKKFIGSQKFIYDDSLSYVMDKKSSIDIDDLMDFKLAELLLGEK